ncbi:hypothetical protein DFH06DRAFT_1160522 [Mycena polygramma]|nr:hypothetical protein DFH06DRAFT_1160522 [Mycena polygramma]
MPIRCKVPDTSLTDLIMRLNTAGSPNSPSSRRMPMLKIRLKYRVLTHILLTSLALGSWIAAFVALLGLGPSIGDDIDLLYDDEGFLLPGVPSNILVFLANLITTDFDAFSLTVFWYFGRYGNCQNYTIGDAIEIYLDPTLASGSSDSTLSSVDPGAPVFRIDVDSFCNFNDDKPYVQDLPVFQSDFRLMPWIIDLKVLPTNSKRVVTSTAGNYPFDNYHALVNMSARLVSGDLLQTTTPIIINMTVSSLLSGFSVGTDYLSADGDSNYVRSINLTRSAPVKIYGILVSVSIVFVSLVLFMNSIDYFMFGYKRRVELMVLPVATVFAFTQLRQTLPGVPTVGTILDYYINLPCFFLLALSSIVSIISLAWSAPFEGDSETRPTWLHKVDSRGLHRRMHRGAHRWLSEIRAAAWWRVYLALVGLMAVDGSTE